MEAQTEDKVTQIDVEELIRSKNARLARLLPRFLIRYLKRIIHQEEVNKALRDNKDKIGVDFVRAILKEFGVLLEVRNFEKLPAEGRICVIANHPLGGLDGMALMQVVGEKRKPIRFPVNDLLLFLPNLRPLFIPVNKHGSNAENAALFDQTFASEDTILYFPAGLCSRKKKGVVRDLEWKKTIVTKAKKHKRDIVPVHIDGENSKFFYRLSNRRRFLGIKANIEMLYLVDEMYNQKNKKLTITFGEPIPYTVFDRSRSDLQWAAMLKRHIYRLKDNEVPFNPQEEL